MKKKKTVKSLGVVFSLTIVTFLETTNIHTVEFDRLPGIFFGCFITVLLKYIFFPKVKEKIKNKKIKDSDNQETSD